MIVIYACAIFFTLSCESLPLDREYTANVGSVLFTSRDAQKKQWGKSELGLLQARRYFQNLLPPPIFVNTFNEEHVDSLLAYFRDAYGAIKKEAKDPETDTIMTTALSDAIGGYLKAWVLPVAKLDYYGGTISQTNVVKIFQFYNEIKRYLDTDGEGWRTPDEKTLNSITINVAPLQLFSNTRSMKDACDTLAYFEKTPTGLTIPIPNVNWNEKSSTLFVPLKNATLMLMNTPDTAQNLVKYYHAARSCIQTSHPKEQEVFDKKFQKWLINEVVPHLKDENLYLALGSVLTLVNRTRDFCDSALEFYVNKCKPPPRKKKPKFSLPSCDITCKKVWILTVILIIEIAWCIPALIYVVCSKKKDCSSHVYLFMDNDNKKDKEESKMSCFECDDTSAKFSKDRCANAADLKVIRNTVFSNTEYLVPDQEVTKSISLNRSRSSIRTIENPELYCVSKKSSRKKPSVMSMQDSYDPTQILALSSNETFGSKQSGTKSRHLPPTNARSKKIRDKDECKTYEKHIKLNDTGLPIHSKKPEEYNDYKKSEEFDDYKKYDESSKDCRKIEIRKQSEHEAHKKLKVRKQLEECRKLEEQKKAEQRKILEECKKLEERKKAQDRRRLEEYKRNEERKKAEERKIMEECKKLEERKKAEERKRFDECKKLEERKKAEERKRFEECKKFEERKKAEERKRQEECKKQEERKRAEERKRLEECKKLEELKRLEDRKKAEERKILEECKRLEERKKAEELRILEEGKKLEESKKAEERKRFEQCKKLEERKKCEDRRKRDECKKLHECPAYTESKRDECTEVDESRKHDECTEVDVDELVDCRELEELQKLKKPAFCRFADDCNAPVEQGEFRDVDLGIDNDETKQFEECRDFDESGNPDYQVICDPSCTGSCRTGESSVVNEFQYEDSESNQNADNFNTYNNYDDYNELTCCQRLSSQETCGQAICPCTECINKVSTISNETYCEKSFSEIMHIPDKQVELKTTRFQVTKEYKGKGEQPYLEITIDRPGTEICVDMSQCRTHNSPYRPSKIPKPATCSIIQSLASQNERQPYSTVDKHKSLIPQRKKKTSDDMDLKPCHCSKSIESKLNGSF